MTHPTLKAGLAILAACLATPPAFAAPFCLKNQVIPSQCIYYDANQCQHEAQKQNAECVANPAEVTLNAQFGKYCVVTSGGASNCNYTDPGSCGQEARRQNGACTPAPNAPPLQAPDPYSTSEGQ